MIAESPYKIKVSEANDAKKLTKNIWLVILHASRIPPHVGILVDGNYNSLTIKGHELNVSVEALIKTITQKKIESIFIQLPPHPVFSLDYIREISQLYIQQHTHVKHNEATCLSPIKLILQEFYAIPALDNELLFEVVERLHQNQYVNDVVALNVSEIKNNEVSLPIYTNEELQRVIETERSIYYKD